MFNRHQLKPENILYYNILTSMLIDVYPLHQLFFEEKRDLCFPN